MLLLLLTDCVFFSLHASRFASYIFIRFTIRMICGSNGRHQASSDRIYTWRNKKFVWALISRARQMATIPSTKQCHWRQSLSIWLIHRHGFDYAETYRRCVGKWQLSQTVPCFFFFLFFFLHVSCLYTRVVYRTPHLNTYLVAFLIPLYLYAEFYATECGL